MRTAIEDIRVFNGWRFDIPQTVCLDSGYIVDIGRCSEAQVTVNGTGKFLIPGLIDSHLHLTDVQSLEDFTSFGCTTAIHMNCMNSTQCDMNANQPGLASFIHAGRSAVGNGSLHERQDPTRLKDTLIYLDTDVTQWTSWQFGNVSDFTKITAEVNGPSTQQQTEIIQIAAYDQAVNSMTDGIQHVPDDGIIDAAAIQKILEQGQFVTPTLNVFEYAYRDPGLQQYFDVKPGSNRTLDHAQTNAQLLYEAGVPLIAGTDSVGSLDMNVTTVSVPFGLMLHYELQNFVKYLAMSPAEAINAATREAAKWHRVLDRGSVEIGKRADIVMLNSDPLVNITNTLDIAKIWVLGVQVSHVYSGNSTSPNPGR
ncbi:putative Amidohydrolase-related domain-containing protein [Seiridium cardinale]